MNTLAATPVNTHEPRRAASLPAPATAARRAAHEAEVTAALAVRALVAAELQALAQQP